MAAMTPEQIQSAVRVPSQLERLAKPFPARLIHDNPSGGGSYVKHSVVTEKLLAVVGPFSFELVKEIRGAVAGTEPNPSGKSDRARRGSPPLADAIVGAVCRLSVEIDGRSVWIEEVGDCESPLNWPHDGARLKDAMSDALKRCAMRLGVTLHLWSGPEFSLYDQLRASHENAEGPTRPGSSTEPHEAPTVESAEPGASAPSAIRKHNLKARCVALTNDGVSVPDAREALELPLVDSCNDDQLTRFESLVSDLEAALEAPFEKASK
jgi:hypothetical protein